MRWRRIAAIPVGLAVLAAVAWFGGVGPRGFIAGGWLWGDVVREPVGDWSFTDRIAEVQVQTRLGPLPYSVTTWNLSAGDVLYIPSGDCSRRWVRQVLAHPDVRVRIDGRIYERRALREEDLAAASRVAPVLLEKYLGIRDPDARFSGENPTSCLLRLEPRS
jgi:hypothetical protein